MKRSSMIVMVGLAVSCGGPQARLQVHAGDGTDAHAGVGGAQQDGGLAAFGDAGIAADSGLGGSVSGSVGGAPMNAGGVGGGDLGTGGVGGVRAPDAGMGGAISTIDAAPNAGGAPGTGGKAGAGGMVASGGSPGTAGAAMMGGSMGTAGAAMTGGSMGTAGAGVDLTHGLVAFFKLDEGSGASVVDSTGQAPAGGLYCHDTTTNAETQDGSQCGNGLASWDNDCHHGACLDNAYWNYEKIPDWAGVDSMKTFTVSAWVRRILDHTDRDEVLVHRKKTDSTGNNDNFRLILHQGRPEIGADFNQATAVGTIPVGSWHHLAGTYDGNTFTIYVDGGAPGGETVSVVVGAHAVGPDTTAVTFMCEDDSGVLTNWADAVIDEVRLYNRALSATEIAALATL